MASLPPEAHAQSTYFWRSSGDGNNSGSWQANNTQWWLSGVGTSGFAFGIQWWDNNNFLTQTNTTANVSTHAFHFTANASSGFTFVGSSVRLFDSGGNDPFIRNASGATHTFNFNLSADGDAADPLLIVINGAGGLTFNGTVNNQGSTINVEGTTGSAATVAFNGVMSGSGGLYKTNANTILLMTAANTYSGQTTIAAGTLRLAGSGSLANSAVRLRGGSTLSISNSATVQSVAEDGSNGGVIAISNGATLTINGNATGLFQNSISGAGNLTFAGGGLSLYGSQTYSGTTTVTGGTLSTSVAMSSGAYSLTGGTFRTTAANLISDTASMTLGGGTLSIGGTETFGNSGVTLSTGTTSIVAVDSGITATTTGTVTGSGNLVKSNAGQFNLSGNNDYTGTTTVVQGSLEVQTNNALGTTAGGTTVNTGAELRMWNANGFTVGAEALTLSGDGIGSAGALRNISGANVWQGTISNAGGARINSDAGSLTLSNINSGANNLYFGGAGNITVNGQIASTATTGDGALHKNGAGTLTLTNNNSGLTGLVRLLGGTISITNNNSLGSGTLELGGLATRATLSVGTNTSRNNGLLIQNASTNNVINVASGSAFTVTGSLTQSSGGSTGTKFAKDGAGTLVFGGTGSTYAGQLQIGQGTVIIGTTTAYGTNTDASSARAIDLGLNIIDTNQANNVALLVSNGVTLSNSFYVAANTNNATRTIGLAGSGSATFNNQFFMDGTMIVDAGASASDSITISGNITNVGGVIKTNLGILVLSASNNYSGGTTLGQGTLRVGNNLALGTAGLTINNGGTFASSTNQARTITNAITMGGNATFGDATGTGALTFSNINLGTNSRTITVSANTTIAGQLSQGNLTKNGTGALQLLSAAGTAFTNTTLGAGTLRISNVTALGSGTLTVSGANSVFSALANLGINNAVVANADFQVGETSVGTGDLVFSNTFNLGTNTRTLTVVDVATISGQVSQGNLIKVGAGTLTLSGANAATFTNATVGTGVLAVSGGSAISDSGAVILSNVSGATFLLNTNETIGSLQGGGTTGGNVSLAGASTLTVAETGSQTFAGLITNTGALVKSGAGTMILTGANTFGGGATLSAGTLRVGTNSALGTGGFTIGNNTIFASDGSTARTITNAITMNGNVQLGDGTGTGALTLSNINLGTANRTFTVSNNTTVAGAITNTGGLTKDGAGTLTLNGANTYTGLTTVSAGVVTLGGSAAIAGNVTVSGGTFNLGAANQITNTSAVIVSGGTLNFGGFNDEVSSFTISSGNFTNGTAIASTYALQGGTVAGNLGAGTATVTGGTTALDGTLGATTVNVNSGTINLGSNDRLDNAAAVTVAGGTLGMGTTTDTVGSFTISSGTLGGTTGVLTASTYALQGGNVNAGLGAGAITVSSGTTALGSAGRLNTGSTLTINSGQLTLGGAETVASFAGSGGTLALGNNAFSSGGANTSTSFGGVLTGTGTFTKTGTGTLTMSGNSTGFTGKTTISGGAISVSAAGNLGANPASAQTDQLTLSGGGRLNVTTGFTGNANAGITMGTGGGTIDVASGQSLTQAGGLNGSGALSKQGAGSLVLGTTAGNYSGTLTISGGTVRANTSLTSATAIVATNAILGGSGSLGAVTVQAGGRLSPGNSVGNLSVSSLTLEASSGYDWEIDNVAGTAGTNWDLVTVGGGTGTVAINATQANPFTIYITGNPTGWNITNSYSWTIIDAGTLTGFAADAFAVNLGNFTGTTPTGNFSFSNVSGNLIMAYTAAASVYNVTVAGGAAQNQDVATGGTNQFTGDSALNKLGAGTLIMTNPANNYTGVTTVKEGTLQINVNAPNNAAGALGTTTSAVFVGDSTNAVAAGFNFGAANVTNNRGLTVVAGTGTADRIISSTAAGNVEQAGSVVVNTNTVFSTVSGGTMLVSGAVSGAGNITISNSGTAVFSVSNGYTGTTTILNGSTLRIANNASLGTTAGNTVIDSGGTLALSNGITEDEAITLSGAGVGGNGAIRSISANNTLSGNLTLAANSRINSDTGMLTLSGGINGANFGLTVGGAGNTTISSNVTNSFGGLTKDGAGSLILSGGNTYTGTTTINAGVLEATGGSALADGGAVSLSNNAGATFLVSESETIGSLQGGGTTGGNVSIASGQTLTVAETGAQTFSGVISNAGGLTKTGAGTTTLSGANTYTGATTVTVGELALGAADVLSDSTAVTVNGGTLNLGANSDTVSSFTISSGTLGGSGGTLTASTYALQGGTVTGNLGAGTATVTTGTTTLNGTLAATTVNVNSGTLSLGSSDRLANSANVTVAGGTLGMSTVSDTVGSFTISSGTLSGTTGTLTASTYALQGGTVDANLGAGTATVTTGTTALNGTLAATTVNVNSGTLNLGSANRLSDSAALTISGGTLGMGAVSDTVSSFTISSGTLGGTTGVLTASTYDLQGGAIDAVLGAGAITVSTGTTTLGSANRLNSGSTLAINSGQLTLGGAESVAALSGSGGTLALGANTLTTTSNSDSSFAGTITGTGGGLIKAGTGNLVLSGNNSYTGTTTISAGTVTAANNNSLGTTAGSTTVANNAALALSNNITIGDALSLSGTGVSSGGALRSVSGNNTNSGAITLAAASRINADSGSTLVLSGGISGTGFGLTIGGTGNTTIGTTGINTGASGTLTKDGSGTLTITAAGNYTGLTTVSAGALNIQNATATGTTAGGISVTSGAALELQGGISVGAEALTLNGTGISSGGALRNISGNNIYGGAITLGSATRINSDADTLTLTNGISGTQNLSVGGAGNTTISGVIGTSTGTLTKDGLGTLLLSSGANTFSGNVTISAGTLAVTNGGAIGNNAIVTVDTGSIFSVLGGETVGRFTGAGTVSIASGQVLTTAFNSASNSFSGTLTGSGGLTKEGSGTFTLSGNNTGYSGTTLLSDGAIFVGNNGAFGSGLVQIDFAGNTGTRALAAADASSYTLNNNFNLFFNSFTLGNSATAGSLTLGASTNTFFLGSDSSATFRSITVNGYQTIGAAVTGGANNNIVKTGTGTLALSGTNTFSGGVFIDQGAVDLAGGSISAGVIGIGGGDAGAAINASNAMLRVSTNGTFGRNLTINGEANGSGQSGTRTIEFANSGGTATLSGNVAIEKAFTVNVTNSGATGILGGVLSGAGGSEITVAGNGTLGLTGTSTTDARWTIGSGSTLAIGASRNLGEDPSGYYNTKVTLNGGTLQATTNFSLNVNVGVQVAADSTISVGTGLVMTNPAIMGGTATLTKAGGGTLVLSGINTNSGRTAITGGVLSIGNASNLGANPGAGVTNQLTLNGGELATTAGLTLGNRGVTVLSNGGTINVTTAGLTNTAGLYGTGNLTKSGLGTMTLSGTAGAYAGNITVTNGTLQANTTLRGANISVGNASTTNGSVLMGTGSVGTVTINTNGQISPGNSVGTLTVSNTLTFNGGGSYLWEITNTTANTPGVGWDLISVDTGSVGGGTLTIGSEGQFTVLGTAFGGFGFDTTANYTNNYFMIVRGNVSGSLDNLAFSSSGLGNAGNWSFSTGPGGTNLYLNYTAPFSGFVFTNGVAANQGDANLVTNNAAGAFAIIADQGGVTSVTISNSAPLTFTNGANSYTGGTAIEQGILVTTVDAGNLSGGAFGVNSGNISLGSISGGNTNAATLLIGADGVTVSKGVDVNAGGTGIRTIGATNASGVATYSGNVVMNTNVTLSASNSSGTTLFTGTLGGSGAVAVAGAGTVTLAGANTGLTNNIGIASGATLVASNSSALGGGSGTTTVSNGATLALAGNINEDEAVTIAGTGVGGNGALRNISGANTNTGTITLSANATIKAESGTRLSLSNVDITGAANRSVTFDGAGTNLVTGSISTAGGSLTNRIIKSGSGELVISNNGTTGTGQLRLGEGTVVLAAGSLTTGQDTGTRAIDIGLSGDAVGTSTAANATLLARSGVTVSNSIYIAPSGGDGSFTRTIGTDSTSGTITYNNQMYLGGSVQLTSAGTANLVYSGNITNDGTANVTKIGAGSLTLSANNTWRGGLIVAEGTTILSGGDAVWDTNAVTVSNNATLALGASETIGSLAGAGTVTLGANNLVTGSNSASTTFSGVIGGGGGIFKNGTGTFTLAGANTFAGDTIVNAGTLAFSNGTVASSFIRLGPDGSSGNSSVLLSDSDGGTTVSAGLVVQSGGGARSLVSSNSSGTNTYGGSVFLDGNATVSQASSGSFNLTGSVVDIKSQTLTLDSAANGSLNVSSVLTNSGGTGTLVKTGAGTATLTGANTYSGGTLISAGTLQVGDGGATGQLGAGNVTNNASLVVNRTGSITIGNTISGTGSLTKLAAGTLTLSASNTFQGGSTLSGGALRVAHANALGTGAMVSSAGTTLEVTNSINVTNTLSVYNVNFLNGGNTLSGRITNNNTVYTANSGQTNTLSGFLTGEGSVTLIGGGVLNITGTTNNYTGNTVISNGTIRISTLANSNAVSSIGINNNVTLAGTATSTNANASTSAVIDYTGGNVTTDRTFVMNNDGGAINISNAATTVTMTGSASGTGKMIVSGPGTLVLSNASTANSFAPGSIQVNSGTTLSLGASNQIGDSTGLILNGGTFLVGAQNLTESLGTLTLSASSIIDFGAFGNTGLRNLTFANSTAISWASGAILTITNWQGVAYTPSAVSQIMFGDNGLTGGQLDQIRFAGFGGLQGGFVDGQLVPVPEPRVYAAAVALLAAVGWRERKRLRVLIAKGLRRRS